MPWRGDAVRIPEPAARAAACVLAAVCAIVLSVQAGASAQMPDLSAMSGQALPSPDLPVGTVTVRVVRGAMTNNLAGVDVELHARDGIRKAATGADGRAQFDGLTPGAAVRAVAVVGAERLESAAFEVPASGGVRMLLVARSGGDAAPDAEPQRPSTTAPGSANGGRLSIGSNSRIALEFSDDVLQVFYLLEIVNRSRQPVEVPGGLVFDVPAEAEGTSVLEGSTPLATVSGDRVTLGGPVPPGTTPLQIGFRVDSFADTFTLEQVFPLPIEMVVVAVQRVGDLRVSSPQLARTQDVPIQNHVYTMGTGPALAAGAPFVLSLSGLPHHPRTGLWLALALAGVIVGWGAWLAWSPGETGAEGHRQRLEAQRAEGLSALAALERSRRAGTLSEEDYAARRTALLGTLEGVYAELEEPAVRDVA